MAAGKRATFDVAAIGGDLLDAAGALDPDVQIAVIERYLTAFAGPDALAVSFSGNHDADARNAAGEWFAKWLLRVRGDGLFVDGERNFAPECQLVTLVSLVGWAGLACAELRTISARRPQPGSSASGSGYIMRPRPFASQLDREKVCRRRIFARVGSRRFGPDFVLSGHIHNAPFYPEGSMDRSNREHLGVQSRPSDRLSVRPRSSSIWRR